MKEVYEFLKNCGTYYLATTESDQPRVRPFGTVNIFDGKLYIQTGKSKDVFHQIENNPKVEICAFNGNEWIRITGVLKPDNRIEAKKSMLDNYPDLQKMYSPEDENTQVLYFEHATAVISSFVSEPKTIEF